jgi:hypothetical protein
VHGHLARRLRALGVPDRPAGRVVAGSLGQLVKPDGQWTPLFDKRLRAAKVNSDRITLAPVCAQSSAAALGSSTPSPTLGRRDAH